MTLTPCPTCGAFHTRFDTRAVGVFQPDGPRGYIAQVLPEPRMIYPTRAAAYRAICVQHPSIETTS